MAYPCKAMNWIEKKKVCPRELSWLFMISQLNTVLLCRSTSLPLWLSLCVWINWFHSLIKHVLAQLQLERDYAAFRARKGLQPSAFFPSGRSSCTPSAEENLSMLHHPLLVGDARTCLPWRICAAVGLNGAPSIQPERHSIGSAGVLRRVEVRR